MWSRIRSLSFKFTLFYILSVFIISGLIITFIEYDNYQKDIAGIIRDTETGPAYINGAKPDNSDIDLIENSDTFRVKSYDVTDWMARYKPFLYDMRMKGSNIRMQTFVDGPMMIDQQDYYSVTFDITDINSGQKSTIGPVTIPNRYFAATIAALSGSSVPRWVDLYYLPFPGHSNLIFLVSVNRAEFPVKTLGERIVSDIGIAFLLALIFSIVFGWLISRMTIGPLKRVTRTAELLSRSDLSQRVKYESRDEIGRLAKSFNEMADKLEKSFNTQKRFISDSAHELRTPLASMKTAVTRELINNDKSSSDEKLLSLLSERINYMENLVNDLLFLSRVDEGKLNQEKSLINFSEIALEAEEIFQPLFEDKNIHFTCEVEPELYINSDRVFMLRVISNLLDNAAKNTPSGGSVSLGIHKRNENAILEITDTGPGISEEHLPFIFERFYKIPSVCSSGYGLGLAIVKSIVNSSGGEISVSSNNGSGAKFTIKLPLGVTKRQPLT